MAAPSIQMNRFIVGHLCRIQQLEPVRISVIDFVVPGFVLDHHFPGADDADPRRRRRTGGRASTGREPMLSVKPEGLHQRIGLVFGSKNEVERIERYHHEPQETESDNPLFAERSLFRL